MKNTKGVINDGQLLKVSQVASVLNISQALAYRLIQQKRIRSVHVASSLRVRPKDLQHYIETNLTPSTISS